ncbi:hypothetical protein CCAND95_120013 [Capnocytophaga canis]|uniref:Uncharacterized protein n=1 Tax=Capnocytophaga canis TaxID=1848903 RepID=A0A0B7I3T9_9FLAO|nr:hypothetical protein CCAND95_120013 [Capnocytophaga canis]CEN46315.1 hypothetical protein CCAND38_330033 [Capnocytophaga canis]
MMFMHIKFIAIKISSQTKKTNYLKLL